MGEPQQTQPWQGAYPDLSALNELFSPQAAVNSEQQPSPWIAFLNSLGLQPIPASQPAQQQAQPTQDQPSAPPAPETQQQDGQTFAGTNSAAWGQDQGYHQSAPGSPPSPQQPNGHTCGYSCGAPHISQLLQAITSSLRHFLLHHGLLLHPLQPPRLPHPVRPLCGVGHLSPPPPPAHRAGQPPPLLRHHLPPPPLRPRPPPALPPQAARARPASG